MSLAVPSRLDDGTAALVAGLERRLLLSLYAVVPALLTLLLGFRGISGVGLWVDEFFTWEAVRTGFGSDLGELPQRPYYIVEWLATGGGRCLSETCLRYPSVFAMAGATYLAATTARRVANRRAGLSAGLLMVLAPGVQRFAQEARSYALGTLFVCLTTYILVRAVQGRRNSWWVLYVLAICAGALIQPVTLAALPAHGVLLYGRPLWRTDTKRWLISCIACTPLFAAGVWALTRYSFIHKQPGDIMVVHPQNLIQAATWVTSGGALDNALVGAFAGACVILALWSRVGTAWLIATCGSLLTIWIVSIGPMMWWQGRSFIPFCGLVAIAASVALGQTDLTRNVTVLVVLALLTVPFYTWNRLPWSRGYDYRTAAQAISAGWLPGDSIVDHNLLHPIVLWSLEYYGNDPARFEAPASPEGRRWVTDNRVSCEVERSWDLGIGNTLRLCKP